MNDHRRGGGWRRNRRSRLGVITAAVVLAALTGGAVVGLVADGLGPDDGSSNRVDAVAGPTTSAGAADQSASSNRSGATAATMEPGGGPTITEDPGSTTETTTTGSSSDTSTDTTSAADPETEPTTVEQRANGVARFRNLATADELGTEQLTDQDILDVADALCVIAGVEDTTGFATARAQIAAEQAPASALTPEQLSGAINIAVRTFCPVDAERLGL